MEAVCGSGDWRCWVDRVRRDRATDDRGRRFFLPDGGGTPRSGRKARGKGRGREEQGLDDASGAAVRSAPLTRLVGGMHYSNGSINEGLVHCVEGKASRGAVGCWCGFTQQKGQRVPLFGGQRRGGVHKSADVNLEPR